MRGRKPRIAHVAWGMGGFAVAALLLLTLLPREPALLGPSVAEQRLLQRLGGLSHTGLVYPRVVELTAPPLADYRAGATNGSGPDLSVWAERFAADAGDGEAAFWLASGHLARGQRDLADDVLRRALRRSPRSLELRHLAAIAAYQRSDLAAAAAELQAILGEHPDQPLARLNLAVIDLESGRIDEARPALEALAASGSPIAVRERALRLLAGIESPRP